MYSIRRANTHTIRLTALAVRYLDQIVELIVELDDEPTYTMTHKLAIY